MNKSKLIVCFMTNGKNAISSSFSDIAEEIVRYRKCKFFLLDENHIKNKSNKDYIAVNFNGKSLIYKMVLLLRFYIRFVFYIKHEHANGVFFYFDNTFYNAITWLLLKCINVKKVIWIHDVKLHFGGTWRERIIRLINSMLWDKQNDRFIVSYKKAKYELVEKYDIEEENIYVCKLPEMTSMEFPEIKKSKVYDYIFFGRLEKYKGICILLELIRHYGEKKFLVVGRGPMEDEIKKTTASNLDFINEYVSDYELAEFIASSKYVLLPYLSATGSQTVQIANYYGVPVIATNVGCFGEYVSRENGFLINDIRTESFISLMDNLDDYFVDDNKIIKNLKSNHSINDCAKKIISISTYK